MRQQPEIFAAGKCRFALGRRVLFLFVEKGFSVYYRGTKDLVFPKKLEMTTPPALSIIIPAYNEERRLPSYLGTILSYLADQPFSFEIIIVDDGSTDGTAGRVEEFRTGYPSVRLIQLPQNRGKGFAVKTGMLSADGELRLFTDADGATPISEFSRLRKAIEGGADVAIASRALRDDSCAVQARLHRKVMGGIFNFLVNHLAVKGIKDTQCGFKLFTAECASSVFPLQRIDDFGFDVEVLFISKKKGFHVSEVPVSWKDMGGSKVSLIRDSFRMFIDILRVRANDIVGAYRNSYQ